MWGRCWSPCAAEHQTKTQICSLPSYQRSFTTTSSSANSSGQVDPNRIQDACDVRLISTMALASISDASCVPALHHLLHRLVQGAPFADCRGPLAARQTLHCASTSEVHANEASSILSWRISLFLSGLEHSLQLERCCAGCWS